MSQEKARRPEDLTRLFVERANAGDADGIAVLYEPDAVMAYPPGEQTLIRVKRDSVERGASPASGRATW